VVALADQIKVDATQLQNAADVLKRDATSMQDYLHEIYNALSPHDLSNGGGDEVGKAIGEQYFSNANQLLHAAGVAAMLPIDIADLSTVGADNSAQIELYLAKINRDLSVGEAKLPPAITEPSTGPGSHPDANPRSE
jgi:hypothetical protein